MMTISEKMDYIANNFTLDRATMQLIYNSLFYAESRWEELSDRVICLSDLLDGIGLTKDETRMLAV